MNDNTITETGCFLDNHRGHYISRDIIELAEEWGYILGVMESYVVSLYQDHGNDPDYPNEAIIELADEAIAWLNSGQQNCVSCLGTGLMPADDGPAWKDTDGVWRCRACTGTGRGPRIEHQNFPPKVTEGFTWAMEDGDFGLYPIETEGECPICGADGTHLSDSERESIEDSTGRPWWVDNCSH